MRSSAWEKYIEDTSFKFLVTAFNHTIPQWRQKDVVESFSYMAFRGKIEMKNPDITLAVFEECTWGYRCINGYATDFILSHKILTNVVPPERRPRATASLTKSGSGGWCV